MKFSFDQAITPFVHNLPHSATAVHGSSDTWLNVSLGGGAIFGAAAVIVGAYFTARYGRRASVSIAAEAQRSKYSCAVVARPSIKAVGVFKVRFSHCSIKVAEIRHVADGSLVASEHPQIMEDVFHSAYVDGGEDLRTSVLVPVLMPSREIVAWAVRFELKVLPRFLRHFQPALAELALLRLPQFLRGWCVKESLRASYWYETVFVAVPPEGF